MKRNLHKPKKHKEKNKVDFSSNARKAEQLKQRRDDVWALSNLWAPEAHIKCKALIPDTVIFKGSEPLRWLFTSRNGDIVKKRAVTSQALQERFRKISDIENQGASLVVRFDSGDVQQEPVGSLAKVLNGEKSKGNIETVQLIPNARLQNSVYRTKYSVINDTGKVSFKTQKLQPLGSSDYAHVESRASRLNEILNIKTQTIIRFLEANSHIRMVSCDLDFIFDNSETPMLIRISEVITVKGQAANDLALIGLPSDVGRLSGEIGRLSYGFPKEKAKRPRSAFRSPSPTRRTPEDPFNPENLATTSLVNVAVSQVEKMEDEEAKVEIVENKFSTGETKQFNLVVATEKEKEIHDGKPAFRNSHYPTPFNCHGDFCNFLIQDPNTLTNESKAPNALEIVKHLLTEKELKELDGKVDMNLFSSNLDTQKSMDDRDISEFSITFKSITVSRQEKRNIFIRKGGKQYSKRVSHYQTPKISQIERLSSSVNASRDGVSVANYYNKVRVCTNCYRVYSTLDKARELLNDIKAENTGLYKNNPLPINDSLAERLCTKVTRRGKTGKSSKGKRLESRTPSPIRTARRYMQKQGLERSSTSHGSISIPKKEKKREEEEKLEDIDIQTEEFIKRNEARRKDLHMKATGNIKPNRDESRKLQSERGEQLQNFGDLDQFIRGNSKRTYNKRNTKNLDKESKSAETTGASTPKHVVAKVENKNCAKILLVEEDQDIRSATKQLLEAKHYVVTDVDDGPMALECYREHEYDLMLISRSLPTLSGIEVTKIIRQKEKQVQRKTNAESLFEPKKVKRLPIVAFTTEASREDLRLYMEVEMDGCVSKPVDEEALLNTVAAATPNHNPIVRNKLKEAKLESSEIKSDIPMMRPTTTGLVSSSTVALRTLPVPAAHSRGDAGDVTVGMFQMDAATAFPYVVMGKHVKGSRLFNFVVVNDFFDTYETMQIFFSPIVAKFPGMQVLLFNCPGQAFTEWSSDNVLNNSYQARCLEELLNHVDYNGTGEFHNRGPYAAPFFLTGFGNGGNIAMCHALQYKPPKMRACLLLNGFSHLDPHLAGVIHDCMNVFSCSPSTRPDLPVYFYTRFIFSAAYLTKVTTPLALNLYTAVHNPITLEGRMQICKGALSHVDLRDDIGSSNQPIIIVQSAQGGLVKPLHVEPFTQLRGGESRTIRECLKERTKPSVVWLRSGHEIFQECRRPISDLLEQLATGYHEKHDVGFLPSSQSEMVNISKTGTRNTRRSTRTQSGKLGKKEQVYFEDRFIDNVLGTLRKVREERNADPNPFLAPSTGDTFNNNINIQTPNEVKTPDSRHLDIPTLSADPEESPAAEQNRWSDYREKCGLEAENTVSSSKRHQKDASKKKGRKSPSKHTFGDLKVDGHLAQNSFDPESRHFDGRDRPSNRALDDDPNAQVLKRPFDVPEVREFMQWRVARNRKRLAQLEVAASQIQRGWRAYLARTLVHKLRTERAALYIQTKWRAKVGQDELTYRKKMKWASELVQRNWRGKAGRDTFKTRKIEFLAARQMQRVYRGKKGKNRVHNIRESRRLAARMIQNMVRSRLARQLCWKMRIERNAAIDIQRVARGYGGRIRARVERDKYLFSKAQSQGIDFGRQMLLEHKLHGTRLQSEVSLLTREKLDNEEKVEALLTEIAEFDKGITALENEMHELTSIETEAKGLLDEEAKIELREQKMRLDREFGIMLGKIADRKEKLKSLEINLQKIDRTRQMKEEELRDLERKLVVLLEEQQQELEQIKRRQEKRGELIMDTTDHMTNETSVTAAGNGGSAFKSGPSPQQQQQANTLMQSSEELMKFGFMSMSLTYFSSMNMIRAMRKVGAVNTVLSGPGAQSPTELLKAIGVNESAVTGSEADRFVPKLERGQVPGEEKTTVASWSVVDVGDWLETLTLGQYRECFRDAAIDGAFLYDLNDDDLRNTLGIEHGLHRKKILSSIKRLRRAEQANTTTNVMPMGVSSAGGTAAPRAATAATGSVQPALPAIIDDDDIGGPGTVAAGIRAEKLLSMVRHGKIKDLTMALKDIPNTEFDKNDIAHQYVDGFGTQYSDELNRLQWHINKPDDHGNTLLSVACQNGHMKVALLLVQKGCNPDHQNNQGNTPLHYAMTYNFYELGAWLADSKEGAGANDTLLNMYELSPYDGLNP